MSVFWRFPLEIEFGVRSGRRRRQACQITLEQNRSGYTVDDALALLSTDVGGDQQIFRRFCRHSFVPQDQRYRQPLFQAVGKLPHRLNRRPFPSVQLERKSQDHLPHFVRTDEGGYVFNITIKGTPLKRLKRLRGPA